MPNGNERSERTYGQSLPLNFEPLPTGCSTSGNPPSPFELADSPPQSKRGLFEELLERNHLVLHYDMQERPDLYDDQMKQLVDELSGGSRQYDQLNDVEKQALDHATLEYATQPPVKSHERARRQMVKRANEKMKRPSPRIDPTMPEQLMPAFWWLK